ncbi:hypothetical protein PC9H_007422 [Pleurotus ostreatus]|uniref:Uncharacterized protein n=1 Tax=Pleurotus ostreatus TaxID=5322 RepID=A0A8H6ZTW5_PLEOS|nr:uncharacterized protein PC9H_007422 [Pleurotus ostreatus]KAF7428201.1 hypothetical protein PC9H_007422 [Pleurotus ostreatus]KAJ8696285.1 hypothetical protein PTI98_006165 [Pleurotus ostreatus]
MSYNYVDPPNSNLTCCICRAPFVKPVTTRTCMHTFCYECIIQALQHSPHCPVDRSSLVQDDLLPSDPIIRSLVDELIIECTNLPLGCTETFQRQLLESHLKDSCQYTDVICGEDQCNEVVLRKDVGKHAHDCAHRALQCEGCQAEIKFVNMEAHISECPATTATCPSCYLDMPRSELNSHRETCPEVIIGCSQSANGCPWTGPRHAGKTHSISCPYEAIKGFFALNQERISAITGENAVLRQKVDTLERQLHATKQDVQVATAALGPWYRAPGICPPISQRVAVDLPIDVQPSSASPSNYSGNRSPPFPSSNIGGLPPNAADPFAPFFPRPDASEQFNPSSPPETQSLNQFPGRRIVSGSVPNGSDAMRPVQNSVAPVNLSSTIEGAFESLRESVVTVAISVESLARRNDIALTNEALRLNEEIMSLRANIHGLRMQVHAIMMDRNAQVTGRSSDFSSSGDVWQNGVPRIHFPPTHGSITKL